MGVLRDRFPRLGRLVEGAAYIKKAIVAGTVGGTATSSLIAMIPDDVANQFAAWLAGQPTWVTWIAGAVMLGLSTYLPANGSKPD